MAGVKGMKTGIPREGKREKGGGRKTKFWEAGTKTKRMSITIPISISEELIRRGKLEGLTEAEYIYKIIFNHLGK